MAQYDLTADAKWLRAAERTAIYYSTWIYAWDVPLPADDPKRIYPAGRSVTGEGVIATANAGAGTYAATDAFHFYRLYLLTGATEFLDTARLLLYNTKQPLNWDPAHPVPGWGPLGIIPEALTLVSPGGTGVPYYLPWETANYLEPMIQFQDVFGAFGLEEIEAQPLAQRCAENEAFSHTRGYAPQPQVRLR